VSLGGRHAFVLGSGIAGLSIAELLSRNGWKITLLEAAKELGGDASRSTQNWLHTGWLYAALPSSAAMLGCSRALRLVHEVYDLAGCGLRPVSASCRSPDGCTLARPVQMPGRSCE
jgi:phytoene dehydrogenase-like protein